MPAKMRLKNLAFPFCQGVRHLNESFFNGTSRYSFRRHCIGRGLSVFIDGVAKNRDGVLKEIRGKSAAAPFFSRALRRSLGISILSVSSSCWRLSTEFLRQLLINAGSLVDDFEYGNGNLCSDDN